MHHFVTVINQTSEAIYDLTTVDKVNHEFNFTPSTANDADVQSDITENSRIIADLCGRVFALQTVIETFRTDRYGYASLGYSGDVFNLSRYPVTNFAALTVGGVAVDPTFYEVDMNAGLIYWLRGFWPYQSYSFFPTASKIQATYTGGYNLPDDAPAPLARACMESIRDDHMRVSRSQHPGVQDVWSGDNRVRYFDLNPSGDAARIITGVSAVVEGLIAPYRRFAV